MRVRMRVRVSGGTRGGDVVGDLVSEDVLLLVTHGPRLIVEVARDHHVVLRRHRAFAKGVVVPCAVCVHAVRQQAMMLGRIEEGPADEARHGDLLLLLGHDERAVNPARMTSRTQAESAMGDRTRSVVGGAWLRAARDEAGWGGDAPPIGNHRRCCQSAQRWLRCRSPGQRRRRRSRGASEPSQHVTLRTTQQETELLSLSQSVWEARATSVGNH